MVNLFGALSVWDFTLCVLGKSSRKNNYRKKTQKKQQAVLKLKCPTLESVMDLPPAGINSWVFPLQILHAKSWWGFMCVFVFINSSTLLLSTPHTTHLTRKHQDYSIGICLKHLRGFYLWLLLHVGFLLMNWIPVESIRNFFISFIKKFEKGGFELWLDSPAGIREESKAP